MTAEESQAGNMNLGFGKYADRPFWWVLDTDPGYFEWALGKFKTNKALQTYGNSDSVQEKLESMFWSRAKEEFDR